MTNRMQFYMPDQDRTNKYSVPGALWDKWDPISRAQFNRLYEVIKDNPRLFAAPGRTFDTEAFDTVAWNSACLAAESLDRMMG